MSESFALPRNISRLIGLGLALLATYTAGFGLFNDVLFRGTIIGSSSVAMLMAEPLALRYPALSMRFKALLWALDFILAALMILIIGWFFSVQGELWSGLYDFKAIDLVFAILGTFIIIELTRRTAGAPLAITCVIAIVYLLAGAYLPWIFRHPSYSIEESARTIWYSFDGIFGLATAVVGEKIFIFFIFGALLQGTGAGAVLLKISASLTGRLRGGSAHAAILSSAFFGTISGSVVANVVSTGVFTIPVIKKQGFSSTFAAAVESAASTGGQIMPPVMGAAAFLMAELLGVPYLSIALAALFPALFYFGSLFAAVAAEASRLGLQPTPKSDIEAITRADWIRSLMFFIPVLVIIATLVAGRSVAMVGFFAVVATAITAFVMNPEVRSHPGKFLEAFTEGGLIGAKIMIAAGAIGIVIGALNLSGLGVQFSMTILQYGHGSIFISLLLTMGACLVLGMGLPTVPAYLIIVLVMGPAIQTLGLPALMVHLFVLYYGVLSAITPPVAIAAYVAAPIAGSRPVGTAMLAVRLTLVGFIIPFVFVYNPSLLLVLNFDLVAFLWVVFRLILAIWLISGFTGTRYIRRPVWLNAIRIAVSLLLIVPDLSVNLAAAVIGMLLALPIGTRGIRDSAARFALPIKKRPGALKIQTQPESQIGDTD